ncbi:MAG: hypothetical protein ACRDKI_02295 [Solirubrobacterales bacterium]
MICTLTTRKIKPGTEQEFATSFDSMVAQLPEDIRNRWQHVYVCQDVTDENTILSFGFFDGTLDELREIQAQSGREEMVEAVGHLVEDVLLDGSYEVIAEVQSPRKTAATVAQ